VEIGLYYQESNIKNVLENIWHDKQQRNKQRREEMSPASQSWLNRFVCPESAKPTSMLAKVIAPVFGPATASEPVKTGLAGSKIGLVGFSAVYEPTWFPNRF